MTDSLPFISVIIPTYRDWNRLTICLKALKKQDYPQASFEIIVVNNEPADKMPDGYWKPDNCIIIDESKPGSYSARNAALRLAKGEIYAFTDSDCIPDAAWLSNAVKFFIQNTDITRIAGNIKLFYKKEKLTAAELYEKVYAFKQKISAADGVSVTGNMFAQKSVFNLIGSFNENLLSGGDFEWSKRAEAAGSKIRFVENVVILHPARHQMAELYKKEIRRAGWIGNNRKAAIKRLFKYSIPPVKTLFHGEDMNLAEKVRVFFIRYNLNFIRSIEEIKISFGKKPNRE
ncbi:MAG: glycosyltransferase family 2 protein [Sphingobacteriaceae bacterium]|nr:MAG: glycosyltransferase family 2 protein [Sphingobacteriaceae bacterium]